MEKLGNHVCPSHQELVECLRKKVYTGGVEEALISTADFPIIDRELYSAEPWNVFKDDDPWEVDEAFRKASFVYRTIYVYTKLKSSGKRFLRTTGGGGTWDGSTGDWPIIKDGKRKGPTIGLKKYFNFKLKGDLDPMATRQRHGHWMMHEYRLSGKSLEGLDLNGSLLAKNLVLCAITQKLDKQSCPKRILDKYLHRFKMLGVLDRQDCDSNKRKRSYRAGKSKKQSQTAVLLQRRDTKHAMKQIKGRQGLGMRNWTWTVVPRN